MKLFGAVCFWITVSALVFFFGLGIVEIAKLAWGIGPKFLAGLIGVTVLAFGTLYHIGRED